MAVYGDEILWWWCDDEGAGNLEDNLHEKRKLFSLPNR